MVETLEKTERLKVSGFLGSGGQMVKHDFHPQGHYLDSFVSLLLPEFVLSSQT